MKAYVILVHKNPAHLERLVQALSDGKSCFFIHIDKSADIGAFDHLNLKGNNIYFLRREKTSWASYELVQAILHGLKAVRNCGIPFRLVILLSGQDYPIKSNAFINQFAEQHADKTFLEYFRIPDPVKWQPNGGLYRINKYFLGLKPHQRFFSKALNFVAGYLPFLRRQIYGKMDPYAGSMWWMINMPAVHYILDFLKKHPGYAAFHQYTFAADEVFFHTILLNAKDSNLVSGIVNNDKRFIKWKNVSSSHPEVISKENLPELISSDALFARKFDTQQDTEILDLIDDHRSANELYATIL